MKEDNLNQLALNHPFVLINLIFGTCPIHKPCLIKLLKQCGNSIRVLGIARLLTQEVIIGFLVQNESLVLLLEKSLTL
jgi:hypothetical protein